MTSRSMFPFGPDATACRLDPQDLDENREGVQRFVQSLVGVIGVPGEDGGRVLVGERTPGLKAAPRDDHSQFSVLPVLQAGTHGVVGVVTPHGTTPGRNSHSYHRALRFHQGPGRVRKG